LDSYLLLKLIHILAAVVVTGTGAGLAFFMLMAYRSNNSQVICFTTKQVILGDWLFTTPAVLTQIISGVMLMNIQGYSFSSPWFYAVVALVIFIGCCWLPVLRIQYRLRQLAQKSLATGVVVPEFSHLMRTWIRFGLAAFCVILIVFYLMVFKPLAVV